MKSNNIFWTRCSGMMLIKEKP